MKPKALSFEFTNFEIVTDRKILFNYKINFLNKKALFFTETIILPKKVDFSFFSDELLGNLLSGVHLMLGISYYKIYCPKTVKFPYYLTEEEANFWNKVYREGLGEFYFRNNLSPLIAPKFPFKKNFTKSPTWIKTKDKALLGIGGGKDSMLAAEILKEAKVNITGFVVPQTEKTRGIVKESIDALNIKSLMIERQLDQNLTKEFNDSYNGHVPISGIFAFLGVLSAVLYGYKYVIVGNEQSSNFGNTEVDGIVINHQWSKGSEFERLFQEYVRNNVSKNVTYFSILRPFHEIRIVQDFVKYKKYFNKFTSCNRNFLQNQSQEELWCGKCPKCIFMYLLFSAFLPKKEIKGIFARDLYEDEILLPLFKDVLGLGGMKPFDCVGTFEEAKVAFNLAKKEYKNSFVIKELSNKIKVDEKIVADVFKTAEETCIPDRYKLVGMKNALILGYGVEGQTTERYLAKRYPKLKVDIADEKRNGGSYLDKQKNYDIVVKTPGIPKEKMTSYYTTATNIFFSEVDKVTIGITATKGKSTTSSLVYKIFTDAGYNAKLIGNIGEPMLEALLGREKNELYIIELSSYQLDDIHYSPDFAVALNLYQDHMTYHGSLENYYDAKKNIYKFQTTSDYLIFDSKSKALRKWAREAKSRKIEIYDNPALPNISTKLIGSHNLENIKAAYTVAKIFNIPNDTIYGSIMNFSPLEHRLELVRELEGRKFYNDSLSTTPESTIAALKSFDKVGAIILGGTDRGYDFSGLEKAINEKGVKNIVLFPPSGNRIFKNEKNLNILRTSSMSKAVQFSYQDSERGDVILLSPASPSFEQFKNYAERGLKFKEEIENLS